MYTTSASLIHPCTHHWTHPSPLCLMPQLRLLRIMLPETGMCRCLFNIMSCSSGGLALRISQFIISAGVSTITVLEAGHRLFPLFTSVVAGTEQWGLRNMGTQLQHGHWGWLTDGVDLGISSQIFQRLNSFHVQAWPEKCKSFYILNLCRSTCSSVSFLVYFCCYGKQWPKTIWWFEWDWFP